MIPVVDYALAIEFCGTKGQEAYVVFVVENRLYSFVGPFRRVRAREGRIDWQRIATVSWWFFSLDQLQ